MDLHVTSFTKYTVVTIASHRNAIYDEGLRKILLNGNQYNVVLLICPVNAGIQRR